MQLLFWPIISNYFFAQQNLIQDSRLLRPGRPRANWLAETYKDTCQYLYGENCAFNINDHQLLSDIKQVARNRTGPLRRNESIHWHLTLGTLSPRPLASRGNAHDTNQDVVPVARSRSIAFYFPPSLQCKFLK